MSQQYQEKNQQNNVASNSSNAPVVVLNPEELASLEPVELQALQGNSYLAQGVAPEATSLTPTSLSPWETHLFGTGLFETGSESIQETEWTTESDSEYTLDGGVRTEGTHDPYSAPEPTVLLEGPLGKVEMENTTNVENYSGSSATLGRDGRTRSGRSQTVDGVVIEEGREITNRIEGTLNHDKSGVSGGAGGQVDYADSLSVSNGDLTEERSRSLGGGVDFLTDQGNHQVSSHLQGGYSRATVSTEEDAVKTLERGVQGSTQVDYIQEADGSASTVLDNSVSANIAHSNQHLEGSDIVTNQVYTKGTVGQETVFSAGERDTTLRAGLDIGGSKTVEWEEENQSVAQKTGAKLAVSQKKELNSSEGELSVGLSGTRGTNTTTVVDDQTTVEDRRNHEGTVYVKRETDQEEDVSNSIGASYAYTNGSTVSSQDEAGTRTQEDREWKAGSRIEIDDDKELLVAGSISHERAVGTVQSDGSSRSDSVIDGLTTQTETGDDLSLDDVEIKGAVSRTYADKTESINDLNEQVVESNSKKISLSGTAKRGGTEEGTRSVGLSARDMNIVDTTHVDGSTSRDKTINQASVDSKKSLSVSTEREHIENMQKEQLSDNTTLTTMQGKTNLKAGASTVIDSEGQRKYVAEGSASYTAYEQTIKHTIDPLAKKLEGLTLGDRDVEGEDSVRMLQRALKADGANIVEDGDFNAETKAAVEAFQTRNGIEVTGEVCAETAEAFPRLGLLHYGATVSAGWHAGKAEASLKGEAQFEGDQIKVKGVAGAKVTMVGGNARIDVPALQWSIGGESMQAVATVGVNAAVLAEVNGTVELDIDKSDGLDIGVGGDLKAFAGAKAGVEVGAELRWLRNSSSHYGEMLKQYAKTLPGSWDDMLVDKIPAELWPQLATLLVGTKKSKVMYAKAGVEGSAGIGAEGEFSAGVNDGMIEVSGKINGTLGLGGGVKTDLGLHAVDGVRLIGVLGMKGMNWLSESIPEAAAWLEEVIEEIQIQTDNYLEMQKQQGGFSGFAASAVDFVGDDLLNLW